MNHNNNRVVVICESCDILHPGTEVGQMIGNPIPYKQTAGNYVNTSKYVLFKGLPL